MYIIRTTCLGLVVEIQTIQKVPIHPLHNLMVNRKISDKTSARISTEYQDAKMRFGGFRILGI